MATRYEVGQPLRGSGLMWLVVALAVTPSLLPLAHAGDPGGPRPLATGKDPGPDGKDPDGATGDRFDDDDGDESARAGPREGDRDPGPAEARPPDDDDDGAQDEPDSAHAYAHVPDPADPSGQAGIIEPVGFDPSDCAERGRCPPGWTERTRTRDRDGDRGDDTRPMAEAHHAIEPDSRVALIAGASVGATLLVAFGRALAPFAAAFRMALPLGTRLERDNVLFHPLRQHMHAHLEAHPGTTVGDLAAAAGAPLGRVVYHLAILQRVGLVTVRSVGGRQRCFLANGPRLDEDWLEARRLGRPTRASGRVLQLIGHIPGRSVSDVSKRMDTSLSSAHYQLHKLIDAGLLERKTQGRMTRHYLTREGRRVLAHWEAAAGRGMT